MMSLLFSALLTISMTIHVNGMIGGEQVPPGSFPYVVTIRDVNRHLCNGVILHNTQILTLGSCVLGLSPNEITVVVGAFHLEDRSAQRVGVRAIRIHPGFFHCYAHNTSNNIAVLRLLTPIISRRSIENVIVSHDPIVVPNCFHCEAIGWGPTSSKYQLQLMVRTTALFLEPQDCVLRNVGIFQDELCARDENYSVVVTEDDLGTPIICNGEMVALLGSSTINTGDSFITQLVAPYIPFIFEHVF